MSKQTYTLTEARQNFFELIRLADAAKPAIIKNAQNGVSYQLIKTETKPKKDIKAILKRFKQLKLSVGDPEELNNILKSTHDLKL